MPGDILWEGSRVEIIDLSFCVIKVATFARIGMFTILWRRDWKLGLDLKHLEDIRNTEKSRFGRGGATDVS